MACKRQRLRRSFLLAPCIMGRQTRSTTKAAAASSRPKGAAPGTTAASTRPQRRLPRPSQPSPQSPQHNKAVARKPKVPRTKQQSRKEKVRKRGGTIIRKGKEIAEEGDTESFVAYKDPNLGWDGIVCLKDTPPEALGEIVREPSNPTSKFRVNILALDTEAAQEGPAGETSRTTEEDTSTGPGGGARPRRRRRCNRSRRRTRRAR